MPERAEAEADLLHQGQDLEAEEEPADEQRAVEGASPHLRTLAPASTGRKGRFDRLGVMTSGEGGNLGGDIWGGLAATLVCLPSAIAFGVAIYAPLGPEYAAQGALAGVLGATALGVAAPLFGGTRGLITVPSGPAAAVMGALSADLVSRGLAGGAPVSPEKALVMMTVVATLAGLFQLAYGLLRGGRLIKYIPYPVTSGYLSGVGLTIFLQQFPALAGLKNGTHFFEGLRLAASWHAPSLAVAAATAAAMVLGPRLTRKVPGPIQGLAGGLAAYFLIALLRPELRHLAGNRYVIGPIGGRAGSLFSGLAVHWKAMGSLGTADLRPLFTQALVLSVLLAFDTLKTSVAVDALTRTRHDSDQELIGQGLGNLASALGGGVPGSGMMGATFVNISSGGRTRLSGVLEGLLCLLSYLLLGSLIAWLPLAALAGILTVVAYRMVDWRSFALLRQRTTWLDFFVAASVVVITVTIGLMAASAVGLALAILLFIREQIRGSVIRRKTSGAELFSKARRLPEEMAVLAEHGKRTTICELQGSLFFGTADQLFSELLPDLKTQDYVILDMRRVQSVDFTAAHMLDQIEAQLVERGARLVFSSLPHSLPSGQDLKAYFGEVGLVRQGRHVRVFPELDEALAWAEDRVLKRVGAVPTHGEKPLSLSEVDLFRQFDPRSLEVIAAAVQERSLAEGQAAFKQGQSGDEMFLIRRGKVKIVLQAGGRPHHLATFGRGDFFGDVAFLDYGTRTADALAVVPTDLFILSRARFNEVSKADPAVGAQVFARLARALALRLRLADGEIQVLQSS